MILYEKSQGKKIGWITFEVMSDLMLIYTIFVTEKWRGLGIGSKLLKRALSECDGQYKRVYAKILGGYDNKECIKMFENNSFRCFIDDGELFMTYEAI